MKKVCIIGGGPAGITVAAALKEHCNVQGFERANNLYGQWADDTDEMTQKHYGSRHSSFYKGLMTNAPKEADLELPNHPWPTAIPSYVPAKTIKEYFESFVDKFDLRKNFKTSHNIENVEFNKENEIFTVTIRNIDSNETISTEFDYVAVCVGHYNVPNQVKFEGEETFPGEMIYSHDFTDGALYKNRRVLTIGGSYSAEDICMLCYKNEAKISHVSSRKPTGFHYDWPEAIVDKPIVKSISGSTVTFADGKFEDYDVIIKALGYIHKFPFLPKRYEDMGGNIMVPKGLYKQCIAIDNEKLWFIGMQNLVYSTPLFQLQGYLMRDVILDKFEIPSEEDRKKEWDAEKIEEAKIAAVADAIHFQTNYVNELSKITNEAKIDAANHFLSWFEDKNLSFLNFRSKSFTSVHTGLKYEK